MEQSGGVLVLARVCCAHLEGRVRPSVHEREEVLPFYRQELG
jgi:hypothetical protein